MKVRAMMIGAAALAVISSGAVAADAEGGKAFYPDRWTCGGLVAPWRVKISKDGEQIVARKGLGLRKVVLGYADASETELVWGDAECLGREACARGGFDGVGKPFLLFSSGDAKILRCRWR